MFEKIISGELAVVAPSIQKTAFKPGQKYYRRNRNGHNSIFYISEGNGSVTVAEKTSDFCAGDVLFLPVGCEYEILFGIKSTPVVDVIDFRIIGESSAKFAESFIHVSSEKNDSGRIIGMIMEQMTKNNQGESVGKELLALSYLYRIIYELYLYENEKPSEHKTIQKGIKFIESRYLEEFEIEEVARECGMCLSLFYKSFKESTGLTPVEYKNRIKIQKAIEILRTKSHSLEDVSKMLNFCNQSYFIRTFKRFTGYTPKQFMSQKAKK